MKQKIFLFLFVFGLFFCFNCASAATVNYYVDPTGTDDGAHGTAPGTSAWLTIQYAITNVANPTTDTIIINIAAGIYTTNNDDINITRGFTNLTLQGADATTTIVQSHAVASSSTVEVFDISSGTTTFNDLTIRYGRTSSSGAAIQAASNTVTLNDCIVYDNDGITTDDSGGINTGGNLTINNSTFYDNDGSYVGALYASGTGTTVTITNSTFFGNTGNSAAAVYLNGPVLILTNTIMTQGSELLLQGT
jgi:hypothetical protein